MTIEREWIEILGKGPRSPLQGNGMFDSDAEIVTIGGVTVAMTIDEFSAEDGLLQSSAFEFGRNLAVAGTSDLVAVGADPRFFLQSVAVPVEADPAWLQEVADGIQAGLAETGCSLIGGDTGSASQFRLTAMAVGEFPAGRSPVSRRLTGTQGVLAVTGTLGDVNLASVTGGSVRLEPRCDIMGALVAPPYGCIDTSDGLMESVFSLSRVNPGTRFSVNLEQVPYTALSSLPSGIPKEALLFGEAGEYELLLCLPEDAVIPHGVTVIGTFAPGRGVAVNGRQCPEHGLDPRRLPRTKYIAGLVAYVQALTREKNDIFIA